jgi:hypothetical protein
MTKSGPNAKNKRWIPYAVFVATVAWVGLWSVVRLTAPSTTKGLFFFLLFIAVTSTVMPPIAYLNARFGQHRNKRTYRVRFVRQSIWCSAFVLVIAWLQMQRVLSVTLALILMAVFILIETFLITREMPAQEA